MKKGKKRSDVGFKDLIQILNKKFFEIPTNISITADDSNDSEGGTKNRTIIGMKGFLDKNPIASGVVDLSEVLLLWWIQPEDFAKNNTTLLSGESGAKGHIAVIHEGEVYMRLTPSKLWLQKFSIVGGGNQIFLYIEPKGSDVRADITRSSLKINGKDLPIDQIAAEFKLQIPKVMQTFMESKLGDENSKSFKERLKRLVERIHIPRFRKDKNGDLFAEVESEFSYLDGEGEGPGHDKGDNERVPIDVPVDNHSDNSGGGGEIENTYYDREGGKNKAVKDGRGKDYPKVIWVSRNPADSSIGLRDDGDMEDRVGRYIMSTNTLFINADFRLINSVTSFWKKKLNIKSSAEAKIVRMAVHASYEVTLADAIIHTRHLARTDGGEGWTDQEVERILQDDMTLTAIASGMFHATSTLKYEIKKDLGRVGSR